LIFFSKLETNTFATQKNSNKEVFSPKNEKKKCHFPLKIEIKKCFKMLNNLRREKRKTNSLFSFHSKGFFRRAILKKTILSELGASVPAVPSVC